MRRRADELHQEQADEQDGAADVGNEVKLAQHRAEERAGEHASVRGIRFLQHAKRLGRDEQAENHHAPEPDDERRQREIPDDRHPVIIIARVEDAATDWITEQVLQPLARGDEAAPAGLAFLLRRYAETGRDDIGDALARTSGALESSCLEDANAGRTGSSCSSTR